MVKPSEAEKNLVQSNASGGAAGVTGSYGAVDRKLYVGSVDSRIWHRYQGQEGIQECSS